MLYIDAVFEGLSILQICAQWSKLAADTEQLFRGYLKGTLIIFGCV
jgi:hypothetical protein